MARTNVVTFRLSEDELAAVDHQAGVLGLGRSMYLRLAAAHYAGGVSAAEAEALGYTDAMRSLRGAASNLGQLAKAANRGALHWDDGDARLVEAVRRETSEALRLYGGFLEILKARKVAFPAISKADAEDAA